MTTYNPTTPAGTPMGLAAEFRKIGESSRRSADTASGLEARLVTAEGDIAGKVAKAGDTMAGALTLPSYGPTAANHATRKAYVDTKAPLPVGTAAVGQWGAINSGSGNAYTLPAGGVWVWFIIAIASGSSTIVSTNAGLDAGGTTIGLAFAGLEYQGFAWRIA